MRLLRVKRKTDGSEFFINQDAIESFGLDPDTGTVIIFCRGDYNSQSGYEVAETVNDILEQIEP